MTSLCLFEALLKARFQDASKKHKPLFIEQSNPVQDCHLQKNICAFRAFCVTLIRVREIDYENIYYIHKREGAAPD